jgi:hypothetical protein
MGAAVHREMASGTCSTDGWEPHRPNERDSARGRYDSLSAKGNFDFEQVVRFERGAKRT